MSFCYIQEIIPIGIMHFISNRDKIFDRINVIFKKLFVFSNLYIC
jgi:hypothetical protein